MMIHDDVACPACIIAVALTVSAAGFNILHLFVKFSFHVFF